jgi:hypothetical protein
MATTTWVRQKSNLWLAMLHSESPTSAYRLINDRFD